MFYTRCCYRNSVLTGTGDRDEPRLAAPSGNSFGQSHDIAAMLRSALAVMLATALPAGTKAFAQAATWIITPSFHAISLYFGPAPTGSDPVAIQYRKAGADT